MQRASGAIFGVVEALLASLVLTKGKDKESQFVSDSGIFGELMLYLGFQPQVLTISHMWEVQ